MTQPDPRSQSDRPVVPAGPAPAASTPVRRRPWVAPSMRELGDVRHLVRGNTGEGGDGGISPNRKKK